jgi:putative spermidine/putrescine transport system substrate-binding protein
MQTKKFIFSLISIMVVTAFVLSACGGAAAVPDVAEGYTGVVVSSVPQDLVTACKAEGMMTIIATPPNWANYGEIFADFEKTSGVKINSLDPNAGSADELAAIEANKGNKGPQAPDIVDVGYAYGATGIAAGDYAAYKVSTWDKIPDTLLGLPAKDPNGMWTGGYYGVMAILTNTAVVKNVPQNWSDLLKPEYKGQVALSGDPLSSNQAIQSVFAATLANGGSLDNAQPGLDFFNQLNHAGNFIPVIAKPGTISQGATPIVLTWDYLAFGYKDEWAGNPPAEITYPSPTIASMYVQAISAYAPHPNCAKLWMEVLHSDEGQLAWMKGYAHGVQQADLESRGVIPADLKAKLPASSAFSSAVAPSPDQLTAAKTLITGGWMGTVGVAVPSVTPAP